VGAARAEYGGGYTMYGETGVHLPHDNSVAPLGQPVCVYRSSVVFCDCGNWVVYVVWAFVSVLLINCC